MSKIICRDKIFVIETENTHYVIGIDNEGFNRHVYWGKKCDVNDYEIDYNHGENAHNTVERFLIAELVSVKKLSDMEYPEWKWREEFLGFQSTLTIYENTQEFKGKRFIVFNDFSGNCLSTGYGEYTITDDELVMITKNSIIPLI